MKKKWKIFIVAHDKIYDDMYCNDKLFNNDNYCFLNVGTKKELTNSEHYCCINQKELKNFISLGKWWAESEGIYNLWRSGLTEDLDFVGFSQYDKEHRLIQKNIFGRQSCNITRRINKYINNRKKAHICLEAHIPSFDYKAEILADESQPNTFTGEGTNCYDYILNDYNLYFSKNYSIQDFLSKDKINLCSSFLIDTVTFNKMMLFWDSIIKSGKLNIFDTEHLHRLQGGLAERYFGLFLAFEYSEMLDLSTIHHWNSNLK